MAALTSPQLPRTAAIGRSADGQWATSELKEYPPALNRALAECFTFHLLRSTVNEAKSVPTDFIERCKEMHVHGYGSRIGPDFHASA